MTFPKKIEKVIKIGDSTGITMKYPSASLYDDKEFLSLEKDYMFELIIKCIENIFDGDEVYDVKDYSKKEIEDFLENLNIKTFEAINSFLTNVPKIEYIIEYQNSFGMDRKITLNSLNDFFTWR